MSSVPEQGRPPRPESAGPSQDPAPDPHRQHPSGPVSEPDTGYTAAGVPTLEGIRDKIETRYGTALGATELAGDTPEARAAGEDYAAREKAAAARLEEIRASLREPD